MSFETLDVRREHQILWVTLNRPESLNALSWKMIESAVAMEDRGPHRKCLTPRPRLPYSDATL